MNKYEMAEVVEIGRARDVILGSTKLIPVVDDSPGQGFRENEMADDE